MDKWNSMNFALVDRARVCMYFCLSLEDSLSDFDHIASGFDFDAFIEESKQKKTRC